MAMVFAEQLNYVEVFLHNNVSSARKMLDDAEKLRSPDSVDNCQINVEGNVNSFSGNELPKVKDYMRAVRGYIEGKPFDTIYEAFRGLTRLKPIPNTIYAPPGTFSKKEIEAYEVV